MKTSTVTQLISVTMMLSMLMTSVSAAPSRYLSSLTDTSQREALNGRVLPLLKAESPRGGSPEQIQHLLRFLDRSPERRIHARNPGKMMRDARSTVLHGQDGSWYLEVMGDGSRFRYRGNIDAADEQAAVRSTERLDAAILERLGRAYITNRLSELIALPKDQQLVFLGTRYLVEDNAQEDSPAAEVAEEVIAHIAIFGREVRGTYVLGPGSKIAVWFSGRGEPVGFDFDWPVYTVLSRTQETLPIDGVWERLYAYADKPGEHLAEPHRFECGYVDLGVFKRQGSPLQAGCAGFYEGTIRTDEGDMAWASIEIIPIGTTVYRDQNWPVTGFVRGQRPWELCQAGPENCQEPPSAERTLER